MSDLDFEQRHRLETEVLPAVIADPEYAASTIVRLEAKVERLRADREQGAWDYCALMDRHDRQHVLIEKLRELLVEARDDIRCAVENNYPPESRNYPSEMRRYQADMDIVHRIDAALARKDSKI